MQLLRLFCLQSLTAGGIRGTFRWVPTLFRVLRSPGPTREGRARVHRGELSREKKKDLSPSLSLSCDLSEGGTRRLAHAGAKYDFIRREILRALSARRRGIDSRLVAFHIRVFLFASPTLGNDRERSEEKKSHESARVTFELDRPTSPCLEHTLRCVKSQREELSRNRVPSRRGVGTRTGSS